MIRVLLADGHLAGRESVRAVLALERQVAVVGESVDGPSTLRLARELRPDIIVLDRSIPGTSGVDVAPALSRELPDTGIVFLTTDPAPRDLALAGGATAYVPKDAPPEALVRAVRATAAVLSTRRFRRDLPRDWMRALDLLLGSHAVSAEKLDEALAQRQPSESLASVLLRSAAVGEAELAHALARASGTPLLSLATAPEIGAPIQPTEDRLAAPRMLDPIDRAAARLVPRAVSRSRSVVVVAAERGQGVLAMADPLDRVALGEAEERSGLRLSRVTAVRSEIDAALERAWGAADPPVISLGGATGAPAGLLLLGALPLVGIAFLFVFREALTWRLAFSLFALACGFFFFSYALKYYLTSAAVLATALFGDSLALIGRRNGKNGNGQRERQRPARGGQGADEAQRRAPGQRPRQERHPQGGLPDPTRGEAR